MQPWANAIVTPDPIPLHSHLHFVIETEMLTDLFNPSTSIHTHNSDEKPQNAVNASLCHTLSLWRPRLLKMLTVSPSWHGHEQSIAPMLDADRQCILRYICARCQRQVLHLLRRKHEIQLIPAVALVQFEGTVAKADQQQPRQIEHCALADHRCWFIKLTFHCSGEKTQSTRWGRYATSELLAFDVIAGCRTLSTLWHNRNSNYERIAHRF